MNDEERHEAITWDGVYANGLRIDEARRINEQITTIQNKNRLAQSDISQITSLRERLGAAHDRAGMSSQEWSKRYLATCTSFDAGDIDHSEFARILHDELAMLGMNASTVRTPNRPAMAEENRRKTLQPGSENA